MIKYRVALVMVLAVLALAAGLRTPARAAAAAAAAPLTAMDYIEIRQLVSRYAFALDTGASNGYDFADLFTSDGECLQPRAKGREQLAALARGPKVGPLNTVHYVTNHVIEPAPGGAIGKAYVIALNFDVPAAPSQDAGTRAVDRVGTKKGGELTPLGGHYEDVYVKTSAGWRIQTRDFIASRSGASDPPPASTPAAAARPGSATASAPASGYVPPTLQHALTELDYIEIMHLVSSYGHALDSGFGQGENGEAYANLFTPDASFGGGTGHDGLVKVAQGQPRGPDWVRHYLTNIVIEPTPEGAKGKQYLVEFDNDANGHPSVIFLGGHYEDTYVKTAAGWRFKTRRLFAPRSGPPRETGNAPR